MQASFFQRLLDFMVRPLRRSPRTRKTFTWVGLGLLLLALVAYALGLNEGLPADTAFALVMVGLTYGSMLLLMVWLSKRETPFRSYHDTLLQERAALKRRMAELGLESEAVASTIPRTPAAQKAHDVQDIIFLNLNQMEEFYVLTIRQARSAFWSSIVASALGLATVLGGIWLFYLQGTPNLPLTAISTIAGIITQFVGVTYYFMHRRASEKMNYYYDQLLRTQDTMLAVRLTSEVEEVRDRTTARLSIISKLVGKDVVPAAANATRIPVNGGPPAQENAPHAPAPP